MSGNNWAEWNAFKLRLEGNSGTVTAPSTPAQGDTHTVVKGETLYRISKNTGVTVAKLKSLNGLSSSVIAVGQVLKLSDAPAVVVFYGTELTDVEDMIIAATNATIAAVSLNLGTCFIGTVSYFLNKSQKLKEKYGILKGEKVATAFVLGYPNEGQFRTFQRNFKEVKIIN